MITRTYAKGDSSSTATYSECEKYRYSLTRIWNGSGKRVNFIMLNPSTATELQNDPTVERCERRARTLGYGSFAVTNIFAWRDTDPKAMKKASDPIGPENDASIIKQAEWANDLIAAWGTHGAHLERGSSVKSMLQFTNQPLFHLGLSKAGHPRHPLYLPYVQPPERWV
ncbi:MAG: DUF1643 domain-containing protein [Tateyamaria sp.]|nr:DUF1643 domain-containing protein [Tateyamaria sp.]